MADLFSRKFDCYWLYKKLLKKKKYLTQEGEYRPTPQQYTSSELTSASVTVHNHPGLHSISHVYPADITSTELQYTGQQVDYSSRETGNQGRDSMNFKLSNKT